MGLSATCRAECDNCGSVVEQAATLDDETRGSIDDVWIWACPPNWIRQRHDKVTGQKYLFYCSQECVSDWLRKQGRDNEADEFEHTIWIA